MTSNVEQDFPEGNFLADFLYIDRPRIAALATQLFDDGNLTASKKSSMVGAEVGGKLSGGIPTIVKGETNGVDKTQETIELMFDATWAGPLNVLRELNERKLLTDEISSANFGQLVIFKGCLQIVDLRLIQKLWRPIMEQESKKAVKDASKAVRAAVAQQAQETMSMVGIVELLPHAVQCRVTDGENAIWSTLDESQLITNSADLTFKHGSAIPGEWMVLGILDAKPGDPLLDLASALVSAPNEVIDGMMKIMHGLRVSFGRSPSDYGITPLVIYRKVT